MSKFILFFCSLVMIASASAQPTPEERATMHRQSTMQLIGQNFGPIAAMVKGQIPWDETMLKGFSHDLKAISSTNIMRGYKPGSGEGRTKVKPSMWDNRADFEEKLGDMVEAIAALDKLTSADKDDFVAQFKKTGGSCKACHDEYKSKEYLN